MRWQLRNRTWTFRNHLIVMGIVNVTPDSFSDGGRFPSPRAAVDHALKLVDEGAHIIDIGGESTRPGATHIAAEEELRRVLPVVKLLVRETDEAISIDTSKAEVARICVMEGAHIVNDVTALAGDPEMPEVARMGCGVILMHMQGTPATMQVAPHYDNVIEDICTYLQERMEFAVASGISLEQIALDPGVGFGKTYAHNMEMLARLNEFQRFGRPICLGASRKGFLGKITGQELERRITASLAVACHAAMHGSAQIIRVHDVQQTRDAIDVIEALGSQSSVVSSPSPTDHGPLTTDH
ncbi:MAG: dihydropteroate synthase [Planctomycetes bacterium]|nr:dihydropteroate synthase [Planctomycetota bacterium]